jgi:hypothetical protein
MPTKRKGSHSHLDEPVQKAQKALVPIKNIDGVNVTLSKSLEGIDEVELVAEAEKAISRLQTETGETGLVIVTSFSHTAITGETEGATTDADAQKRGVISIIDSGKYENLVEPESVGVSLKKVACFSLPDDLILHKLNIAGIGAKSFVSPEYIKEIVDIIQGQLPGSNITPEALATTIIQNIISKLKPALTSQSVTLVDAFSRPNFDNMKKLIAPKVKAASKRNPAVLTFQHLSKAAQAKITSIIYYKPLIDAVAYQFHADNLQSGAAFTRYISHGSCMMNKEYLRYNDNDEEHKPGLDWNVNLHDKNGSLLIGNTPNPSGLSYMMDLITLVKILKRTDKVTTKDILDLLYEKGIKNVVFIDGGCNVFCGDGGMLACSGCHPSLDTLCETCSMSVKKHFFGGGMKNKKTKTTKKKSRIVRTVRGRRMRKSYRRYKRSKTYKR